jgi:hypothetical protein
MTWLEYLKVRAHSKDVGVNGDNIKVYLREIG